MASTVSLSKGVFAFKKSKTKAKNVNNSFSNVGYWRQEEGRNGAFMQRHTLRNYQQCWSSINGIMKVLLDETHSKVFEELINYIKKEGTAKCLSLFQKSTNINKDIPAACLITGVNMPDHATIFDSLTKAVKEKVSPHVAQLSPRDCSTIKMAVYKLIWSLVDRETSVLYESDSDDGIFIQGKSPKKGIKKSLCNMSALCTWYKDTELLKEDSYEEEKNFKASSPSKRKKTSHKSPGKDKQRKVLKVAETIRPVVVVIEEVESVPIHVLQDLIFIISEYESHVPFIFIFGVSTTPSYIHRHLNQEASSSVAMETFQAQPSSIFFSEVIEKLLMNLNQHFGVGGKVFKLLLDIFLFHDLSVKNFVSRLKFCVLEHFLRGEGSFLCCKREDREDLLQKLPQTAISSLKNLPSCKRLFDSLSALEKQQMEDNTYFTMKVSKYLDELENWYIIYCSLVKVLHSLVHSLPGSPLGKQVREVFSICLNQQVTETEEFQSSWKLLSMCAKEELIPKIGNAMKIIRECESTPETDEFFDKLSHYLAKMSTIDHISTQSEKLEAAKTSSMIDLKPSDRFNLKEILLGSQKSKSKTPYEELRTAVLTCFEHMFISYLKPVQSKPFYEVFFFDSLGNVKYQLLGSLRATITTGLVDPHKYLQCTCCKLEVSDELVSSLPDLSLCYKLHLECGRLINLYDWLQAFIALVEADRENDSKRKDKKRKKTVDEAIQARFIQAVSELQLLGFIKPTKRKTDHVQRLTWGGC